MRDKGGKSMMLTEGIRYKGPVQGSCIIVELWALRDTYAGTNNSTWSIIAEVMDSPGGKQF